MQHLAGHKIRRFRQRHVPRLSRPDFCARYCDSVLPSTVQGWEDEGKLPRSPDTVNLLARLGIAVHADWYQPATCARCERQAEDETVRACKAAGCPLACRRAA